MGWPKVFDEFETLAQGAGGASLARYGDGELNLALGGNCISQKGSPAIAAELRAILAKPREGVLVCIPNLARNAKPKNWGKFDTPRYRALFGPGPFGSAFITRPDSAPWIDTPAYWEQVRALWAGRDVVFARGGGKATERSLRLADFGAARSVAAIEASTHRDAFEEIETLQARIIAAWRGLDGRAPRLVILCLGACGTILAHRLAGLGLHALDLGHIGMFMRSAGAYRYGLAELISKRHLDLCIQTHAAGWPGRAADHAAAVIAFAERLGAELVLDYGCGRGGLIAAAEAMGRRIRGYDPALAEFAALPKPADLVTAINVLEHVEADRLDTVLDHVGRLALRGAFLVIGMREGRGAAWWLDRLQARWLVERADVSAAGELTAWLRR